MTEVSTLATTGEAARAVAEWLDRLDEVLEPLRAHVDVQHAGRTLGQMTIDRQLDEFHIGHYEEHADQLDSIA